MAFDVYVGTMTRFFRREWENAGERMAREMGATYRMIHAGGEPDPPMPAEEIRQAVENWCQGLSNAIEPHGFGPVSWDEGDANPYFTDRPGWDGYGALQLWAAYADEPIDPPARLPEQHFDDRIFVKAVNPESGSRFRQILSAAVWVPAEFPFVMEGASLASEQSMIGSVFALRDQLNLLYSETQAALQGAISSSPPEPVPAERVGWFGRLFGSRRDQSIVPETEQSLAEMAGFGLDIFRDLADKACEHRLPIQLSF